MKSREDVIKGLECCIEYDYKCKFCPYADDGGAEDFCYSDELKTDALALLKAQEPRVMTLEEALEAEYVYLDVRPHSSLQCECCILIKDEDGDIVPLNKGFWGSLKGEDYGIDWRCWTSRPDKATREETPWD